MAPQSSFTVGCCLIHNVSVWTKASFSLSNLVALVLTTPAAQHHTCFDLAVCNLAEPVSVLKLCQTFLLCFQKNVWKSEKVSEFLSGSEVETCFWNVCLISKYTGMAVLSLCHQLSLLFDRDKNSLAKQLAHMSLGSQA